jgi:hypothetical protein
VRKSADCTDSDADTGTGAGGRYILYRSPADEDAQRGAGGAEQVVAVRVCYAQQQKPKKERKEKKGKKQKKEKKAKKRTVDTDEIHSKVLTGPNDSNTHSVSARQTEQTIAVPRCIGILKYEGEREQHR